MIPTSSHHRAFLTTDYLTQLISLLKEQGFNSEQILDQSQLREEDFQNNSRISPMQYQQIVENALHLTQDPLLGIKHGQGLSISSHGFVGFAAMAADDLGQALSLAIRYARTRTLLADIRFHKEDDSAVIQVNRMASMPDTFPFVVENIISSFIGVARFLISKQEELSAIIKLTHAPRANPEAYEQLFGAPVLFNQPYNQVCFPEFMLEVPVSTANAISRGLAETECEKLLAQLDHGQDLVTQIRYKLEKMQAFPTLPVMAKALNSSPRTVNRQLAQLNTSYQHTLDEARREKALELLDGSSMSIEQISMNLGYNDPSNFGRAFRRWLGQSPRAYRKSKQ
jgi:AraC-like DNA-binding protein|tara:strand:- start:6728 stop:7747 length:1020 start_codon:yes stop_codon:yes gene_type:complete